MASFSWLVRTLLSILSLYGITCQAALGSDITQVDLIFPEMGLLTGLCKLFLSSWP
jgi:hypothetical protein